VTVGREVAQLASTMLATEAIVATFLGVEDERARLDTDLGEIILASKGTADWPAPGTQVWCITVGGQRIMLGSPGGSVWGVVVSATATSAVVETPEGSGLSETYRLPRGVAASVGDLVKLDHARMLVLTAWPATAPPAPLPDPVRPNAPTRQREAEVNATWDGTGQPNGYWLDGRLLYTRNRNGGPNYATMGYGNAVTALGIAPESITEAAVYLSLDKTGSAHQGGTHALSGPGGTPAPGNAFSVQPTNGWLALPLDVAQALAAGDARGLMFYGGAGTVLRGILSNPGNGRLRLRYGVEA